MSDGHYIGLDTHEMETFGEVDPHGMQQNEPGAKMDYGKPMPDLVLGGFALALQQVTLVGTFGAQKYSEGGWEKVPNGLNRYSNAMMRHYLAEKSGETTDSGPGGTGLLHAAAVAWNALARLELMMREVDYDGDSI